MRAIDIGAIRRRCAFFVRWDALIASGLIACMVAGAADPASAYRRRHNSGDSQRRTEKKAPPRSGPLFAIVSIADQRVSLYGSEGLVERSPVSTGQEGYGTPTGVFSIVQKEVFHHSNLYGGAPMPHMQRITWSGVAMHAGVLPGYPASHGCIRMPDAFAQRIYGMTKMGQRVLVAPHDIVPADFGHPKLPVPAMRPAQEDAAQAAGTNGGGAPTGTAATTTALIPAKANGEIEPAALMVEGPAVKRLNPVEYAWFMRNAATAKSGGAVKAVKAAQAVVSGKQGEVRAAARTLKAAEAVVETLESRLTAQVRKAERTASEKDGLKKAVEAKASIEARIADARKAVEDARRLTAAKDQDLAAARQAAAEADSTADAIAATIEEATRRMEPVSVFISGKTGRLYVRQAFKPVFDVAVTIKEPERPLGTHVYIALDAAPDGSSLKWSAVSMPDYDVERRPRYAYIEGRRRQPAGSVELAALFHFRSYPARFCRPAGNDEPAAPAAARSAGKAARAPDRSDVPDTAAGALDRIGIPEAAAKRIAGLAWAGASILISDRGMSGETGESTDFIVLTRSKAL